MEQSRPKIKYSVRVVFIAIFFCFLAVAVGMLNIYPTTTARDVVFSTKQSDLMSRGSVIRARFADWGARDFTEDKAGTDPNTVSAGVAFSLRPAAGWAVAAEAGMERGRDTHGAWGSLRVDWQF